MSDRPRLEVLRGQFSIEEPWSRPEGAGATKLMNSADGSNPRLLTSLFVYYDELRLYVVFSGEDDHVVATHSLRDAPLYEEDVVEIFLAPTDLRHYFEIEVSPRGAIFDASVVSPDGDRKTMKVDRDWDCEELFAAVRYDWETDVAGHSDSDVLPAVLEPDSGLGYPHQLQSPRAPFFPERQEIGISCHKEAESHAPGVARFSTVVAIPFACSGMPAPKPGARWRANFFRIDRHPAGDEFTAWSPTWKNPPDFHVTDAFGELVFG